ncbi:MAG TPA: hypothetical protein VKS01_00650 [Bryobacteraceae bacterium]|nr:hypothetical protein [Bryobacteraceae bacterium]
MTPSNRNEEPRNPVVQARAHVAALRQALFTPDPEAILACVPGLALAAECIHTVENRLRDQPSISIDELREWNALKADLKSVGRLIEHGARFYRGWARILGSASGYTASGEATALTPSGSIAMKG